MTPISNGNATTMDQAVRDCFLALLGAIQTLEDDVRLEGAEAILDRDDTRADECRGAIERFKSLGGEIDGLYNKWKDSWPTPLQAPDPARELAAHSKRRRSKLRVYLNGTTIEYAEAAETFARTIEAIGCERVARLGRILSNIALVGTSKATGYQSQFKIAEFYVCTHSNNQTKKGILEQLAADLGLDLRVEVFETNFSAVPDLAELI